MGLLDDAIREHLELKRLRGADPRREAREEEDVVGAAPSGGPLVDQPLHANGDGEAGRSTVGDPASGAAAQASSAASARPGLAREASNLSQETVELDMRTVLDEDVGVSEPGGRIDRHAGSHRDAPSDDDVDWETPALQRRGSVNQLVDGDGDTGRASGGEARPIEDVLEETPDFLRDTPEEDRLWFEQRPPRDFDFDD